MYPPRYAILLDGGFLIKKLYERNRRFPDADDVQQVCDAIRAREPLSHLELLRIYFYHAPPAKDELTNPLDQTVQRLANSQTFRENSSLLDSLELRPDFALRLGETVSHGWKLGDRAMRNILGQSRAVEARDLVPNIQQKGVDLRIGLDIARLSLKEMVRVVVVVTGDSDLVPAFRFARREGLRVYLDTMGHGVRRDLKAHVDTLF